MEKFFGMEQQKFFDLSKLFVDCFEVLDKFNLGYRHLTDEILDIIKSVKQYTFEQSHDAVIEYIKRQATLPTPIDILGIIYCRSLSNDHSI